MWPCFKGAGCESRIGVEKMVYDNYVWRGRALRIAVGTIDPILFIEGGGAVPAVGEGGVDLEDCGGNYG